MTPERAGRLAELSTRLDSPHSGDGFRGEMLDFYHVLYDAEHQQVLVDLIDRLRDNVGRELVARRIHDHAHTHRSLVSPVISGDTEAAVAKLVQHLSEVKEAILRVAS